MFDRKILFTVAMQKIEASRLNSSKESFDKYAIDKLALIHRLNLPKANVINLLIGGISQTVLCTTALTLSMSSVDQFLEDMRKITHGIGDLDKKMASTSKNKFKDVTCRGCGKRGHIQRDCKGADQFVSTASRRATLGQTVSSSRGGTRLR
jgi:hypothetical protein